MPVAPNSKPRFAPSDIIDMVKSWEDFPQVELIEEIFLHDMEFLVRKTSAAHKSLLLRAHAHGAYVTGTAKRDTPALNEILRKKFDVLSVVTVRNPIDSFLSMRVQEWMHFKPASFEEYCKRYLLFLKDHRRSPIFRYEDFVENPTQAIKAMCDVLQLSYSPDFVEHFFDYKFSGDSGRSGAVIEPRTRREYDESFVLEVSQSPSFRKLRSLLRYEGLDPVL